MNLIQQGKNQPRVGAIITSKVGIMNTNQYNKNVILVDSDAIWSIVGRE
jgi:hypothetical protein